MNDRRVGRAEMIGGHHSPEGRGERALGIGKERGDTRQRLFFLGVQDVENRADQKRMAGLLPMVAAFERAFGIDQNVGDILDVAHLVGAPANFEQRIISCRARIGRIEEQAVRKALPPAGRQLPVLALDVVDDGRARLAEQGWYDQADTLAAPRRREGHNVLGAVMA
jgi:hypothetical protein